MNPEQKLIDDGYVKVGYVSDHYPIYRKVVNGRGKWATIVCDEIKSITYEQARGLEPITPVHALARKLGRILLPH